MRRAFFYSHDTLGLGHLRRTLSICDELNRRLESLSMLIVTGSAMAHNFRIPRGVDYVKLPSVTKLDNELYESRSLQVPFTDIHAIREEIIFQTALRYRPDFFFVDNVPLGMKGEIRRTLCHLREHSPATKIFLNLRDIIDSADHILPLWEQQGIFDALDRFYDRIFIYGEARIFNPLTEYRLPENLREKARFCGYLPRLVSRASSRKLRRMLAGRDQKFILVTVGGGSDGAFVIRNFLGALRSVANLHPLISVVLLGPEMSRRDAMRLRSETEASKVTFLDFCDEALAYMDAADLIISMGGYNTINEILSLGKRAIVIPRVHPRKEQLIRSERLQELGLLRMIHPAALTPQHLADEICRSLSAEPPRSEGVLRFDAAERLQTELQSFLPQVLEPSTGAARVGGAV